MNTQLNMVKPAREKFIKNAKSDNLSGVSVALRLLIYSYWLLYCLFLLCLKGNKQVWKDILGKTIPFIPWQEPFKQEINS